MTRFIFITGGVVSSLGKGITSACLGAILEARGLQVRLMKLDPYINVDIGGTVGDIESLPFLEAIRQMGVELGRDHVLYIHLTLVPYLGASQEIKTKPTQHSVKELRSIGIQPDVLVCRSEHPLPREQR